MKYDFLIVGAGLFGAVFAEQAVKKGYRCLVIDRRAHVAGNIYTEEIEGIQVHRYGAHIFHTSDKKIWDYINQFAEFNNYINSPIAVYKNETYNLPFNMNTFSRMWNIRTPQEAKAIIASQIAELHITDPKSSRGFRSVLLTITIILMTAIRESRSAAIRRLPQKCCRAAMSGQIPIILRLSGKIRMRRTGLCLPA